MWLATFSITAFLSWLGIILSWIWVVIEFILYLGHNRFNPWSIITFFICCGVCLISIIGSAICANKRTAKRMKRASYPTCEKFNKTLNEVYKPKNNDNG